jgi:hypothetical protein
LETQLKEWTTQFEFIRSEKETVDLKLKEALQQAEEHRRARAEAETRQTALQQHNEKIAISYEVLKDHELSLINDFTNKSKETKQHLTSKVESLKAQLKQKDETIESMDDVRKQ